MAIPIRILTHAKFKNLRKQKNFVCVKILMGIAIHKRMIALKIMIGLKLRLEWLLIFSDILFYFLFFKFIFLIFILCFYVFLYCVICVTLLLTIYIIDWTLCRSRYFGALRTNQTFCLLPSNNCTQLCGLHYSRRKCLSRNFIWRHEKHFLWYGFYICTYIYKLIYKLIY
jgi:hypothetical protein